MGKSLEYEYTYVLQGLRKEVQAADLVIAQSKIMVK